MLSDVNVLDSELALDVDNDEIERMTDAVFMKLEDDDDVMTTPAMTPSTDFITPSSDYGLPELKSDFFNFDSRGTKCSSFPSSFLNRIFWIKGKKEKEKKRRQPNKINRQKIH